LKFSRPNRSFTRPVSLVIAVFVLFAALSNSLAGCSSGTSSARVFSSFDLGFSRAHEKTADFQRFREVYNQYASNDGARDQQFRHFSDAFNRIRSDYVHVTNDQNLLAAAITGIQKLEGRPGTHPSSRVTEAALDSLIGTLDPHSSYLNPEEYKESRVVTSGEFGGLGIEINMDQELQVIRIIAPIADTPAYRAGLKAGDLITHVDGDPIRGMGLRDAVRRLRGKRGTDVRLSIRRPGTGNFDVTITRAVIQIQPVKWRVEGDVGVVRVTHFISSSEDALEHAIQDIRSQLGNRMAGLVLDLRNNPGGLLNQSVAVADAFLQRGEIVSVRNRAGDSRGFSAHRGDVVNGLPMVVLINRGSASASEIVAGALQDHRRAIVMGAQSFGKGSVQTISPLDWDGALRLTTALYYLPSGRTIQGSGVSPDIIIEDGSPATRGRRESDLPNALNSGAKNGPRPARHSLAEKNCPAAGQDGKDKVLGCAVTLLRSGSEANFLALMGQRKSL